MCTIQLDRCTSPQVAKCIAVVARTHLLTIERKDRIEPVVLERALAMAADRDAELVINTRSGRAAVRRPGADQEQHPRGAQVLLHQCPRSARTCPKAGPHQACPQEPGDYWKLGRPSCCSPANWGSNLMTATTSVSAIFLERRSGPQLLCQSHYARMPNASIFRI